MKFIHTPSHLRIASLHFHSIFLKIAIHRFVINNASDDNNRNGWKSAIPIQS